jgi:hypothetical protein
MCVKDAKLILVFRQFLMETLMGMTFPEFNPSPRTCRLKGDIALLRVDKVLWPPPCFPPNKALCPPLLPRDHAAGGVVPQGTGSTARVGQREPEDQECARTKSSGARRVSEGVEYLIWLRSAHFRRRRIRGQSSAPQSRAQAPSFRQQGLCRSSRSCGALRPPQSD